MYAASCSDSFTIQISILCSRGTDATVMVTKAAQSMAAIQDGGQFLWKSIRISRMTRPVNSAEPAVLARGLSGGPTLDGLENDSPKTWCPSPSHVTLKLTTPETMSGKFIVEMIRYSRYPEGVDAVSHSDLMLATFASCASTRRTTSPTALCISGVHTNIRADERC